MVSAISSNSAGTLVLADKCGDGLTGPRRHAGRRDPLAAVVADKQKDLTVVELDYVVEIATQVGGLGS